MKSWPSGMHLLHAAAKLLEHRKWKVDYAGRHNMAAGKPGESLEGHLGLIRMEDTCRSAQEGCR